MQTKIVKINPDNPKQQAIKEAAKLLKEGKLVAFPTETVYGIAANLLDKKAVERLYEIKKRRRGKPFSVHIADFKMLENMHIELSEAAKKIINKFWPGPLTIIAFNDKKEKIGLRMPRNKLAQDIIRGASVPIVMPSANISGDRPPISGEEVISNMSHCIDMILDAGQTEIGIESTVLDVTINPFKVLREGAIVKEELLADYHVLFVCAGNSCRSVMAKGLLEKFLKEAGLDRKVHVDSAGIGAFQGINAAVNTIKIMEEIGIDVSDHKGKGVSPELLKKSDLIFVMEDTQRQKLISMCPAIDSKIRLLRERESIPDPIGRPIEEYRRVFDIIKDAVENIFLEILKRYKGLATENTES